MPPTILTSDQQPNLAMVVKVGGASLFGLPSLVSDLRRLISKWPQSRVFLLVGGGDSVESMRTLHRQFPQLSESRMHWRCIELLDATWSVMCELFPDWPAIATSTQLEEAITNQTPSRCIVRVGAFYSKEESTGMDGKSWIANLLPAESWETTSDVLAWMLARRVKAGRVVLLKRTSADPNADLSELARLGLVDSELARLSSLNKNSSPRIEIVKF